MKNYKYILYIFLVPLFLFAQKGIDLKVYVDKKVAEIEDQIELTIEINGTQKRPSIQLPKLNDFYTVNSIPSTSSNVSIVNGRMTQKVSYVYYLKPKRNGKLVIPSFTIQVEGAKVSSNAISVSVLKNANVNKTKSKAVFIQNSLSTTKPYINQEVTVSTKMYIRQGVRIYNNSISFNKEPAISGVWREKYDLKGFEKLADKVIKNVQYQVYLIRKDALFPTIKGKLSIESVEVKIGIIEKSKKRGRRSLFDDPFFSSFGGNSKVRNLNLSAPKRVINVRSFPANKPDNFNQFSGALYLQAALDKTSVKTNEAIKLTVVLEGEGNFQTLSVPEFFISPDLEKYEPAITSNVFRNRTKIAGKKKIEYVLVPRVAGDLKIGPVTLSYFDTRTKRIKTLTSKNLNVSVSQGKSHSTVASASSDQLKMNVKQLKEDIRYIRNTSGGFTERGNYYHESSLYLSSYGMSLGLFALLFFLFNSKEKLSSNSNLKRKKEASGKVTKVLKNALEFKTKEDSAQFFVSIHTAIVGYVADKLSMDAAGFTSDSLKDNLENKELDSAIISEILDILNTCDFYRFSNPSNATEEMETIYAKTTDVLNLLTKKL